MSYLKGIAVSDTNAPDSPENPQRTSASEDWAIAAPARNRAAPAQARPKGGIAVSYLKGNSKLQPNLVGLSS